MAKPHLTRTNGGGILIKTILDSPEGRGNPKRGDCVVRAYTFAKGIPYAESRAIWTALGWSKKRMWGFWKNAPKVFGSRMIARTGTLGKFIAKNPTGRYFVVINGGRHAIAVVDGVVYDHHEASPLERVKAAWRIT